MKKSFPNLSAELKIVELETRILKFWQDNKIFQKSIDERSIDKEYIFYDGPPFANGLPHYGHILTSYIKDTFPRYFTMKGKRVERRFGWDCHGLPAENSAEKELNISGKKQIEEYGIAKFNDHCKNSVLKYTQIWRELITRLGRWVDFENDYKTMDLSYMESVLWVFKTLYDKGLIYEGNKVLHYCYRCETPLSNFEAKLDDSYRPRKDLSVTVKFKAKNLGNTYFLGWTTTPWTLPSNVALAVGADFDYVTIEIDNIKYILAEACLEKYKDVLPEPKIITKQKGKNLIGMEYEPLFPYFKDATNGFKVFPAEFVNTEDGTGIVHIAPSFGEDDALIGKINNIKAPNPVDYTGCFTNEVTDFAGQNVHAVNTEIADFLKKKGQLLKKEWMEHDYPYCWRCDTPLIYWTIPSWYMKVTDIKDKLVKNNQQINWVPEHIKNGIFGKWLEGAKDWAISRNRYWGTPVPVWKCKTCGNHKVIGSLKEAEDLLGFKPKDLHRPEVDTWVFECEKCKGKMHRVQEVLDCWFESGSMPYAQVHYPFENKERFERNFPADFIVEYIPQTRGWFYTLLVLSSALFDKPPFLNVIVHGVIFAADGRKMSKRLKNYPDPKSILDKYGSDAMRFYLISSPIVIGKNLNFSEDGVLVIVRSVILSLWNSYRFFTTYANADKFQPSKGTSGVTNNLDRYILSKLQTLILQVETSMDKYDLVTPCKEIVNFIDLLNNTYIRRNRRRFWKSENTTDKWDAYETLYEVLVTLCKVIAPVIPFLADEIYKGLTDKESVHLESFPEIQKEKIDEQLMEQIALIQQIITIGRAIREKAGIKVREPRAKVTLDGANLQGLEAYKDWILEELNVKELEIQKDSGKIFTKVVKLDHKKIGAKLGKLMQDVIRQTKQGNFEELHDGKLKVGDQILDPGEFTIEFISPEGTMRTEDGKLMVSIDMTASESFKKEGIARDIVRHIQLLRKETNFNVSDRIMTLIQAKGINLQAVEDFKPYIMNETLTTKLDFSSPDKYEATQEIDLDGEKIILSIRRT